LIQNQNPLDSAFESTEFWFGSTEFWFGSTGFCAGSHWVLSQNPVTSPLDLLNSRLE
jgi:hypothetical protein